MTARSSEKVMRFWYLMGSRGGALDRHVLLDPGIFFHVSLAYL